MHNPIVQSVLVVTTFWWVIAFFWHVYRVLAQAKHAPPSLETVFAFGHWEVALAGVALVLLVSGAIVWIERVLRDGYRHRLTAGSTARGLQCTLGPVPGFAPIALAKTLPDLTPWPRVQAWLKQADPDLARLFRDALRLLYRDPDWPASVNGGHGGVRLWQHSLNVAETGLKALDAGWTFSSGGRGNHPLEGMTLHDADRDLAVVILIAHDLGKLKTYFLDKDGKYQKDERFREHDRLTPRFLARLDATWTLPNAVRQALFTTTAYEHHDNSLPKATPDGTRLLLAFLQACDHTATQVEEGRLPEPEITSASTTPAQAELDEEEAARIWRWFLDAISKPDTINSNKKRERWGFKTPSGQLILSEQKVRETFATECLEQPHRAQEQKGDGSYSVTRELLKVLGEKGVVVCEWNGLRFNPDQALWKAEAITIKRDADTGAVLKRQILANYPAAIVVDLGEQAPRNIANLPPAKQPPVITGPVFPQRALKKPAVAGPPEASDEPLPASDPPTAPAETAMATGPTAQTAEHEAPSASVAARASSPPPEPEVQTPAAPTATPSPSSDSKAALRKQADAAIEALGGDWEPEDLPEGASPVPEIPSSAKGRPHRRRADTALPAVTPSSAPKAKAGQALPNTKPPSSASEPSKDAVPSAAGNLTWAASSPKAPPHRAAQQPARSAPPPPATTIDTSSTSVVSKPDPLAVDDTGNLRAILRQLEARFDIKAASPAEALRAARSRVASEAQDTEAGNQPSAKTPPITAEHLERLAQLCTRLEQAASASALSQDEVELLHSTMLGVAKIPPALPALSTLILRVWARSELPYTGRQTIALSSRELCEAWAENPKKAIQAFVSALKSADSAQLTELINEVPSRQAVQPMEDARGRLVGVTVNLNRHPNENKERTAKRKEM